MILTECGIIGHKKIARGRAIALVSFLGKRIPNKETLKCLWFKFVLRGISVVNIHSATKNLGRKRSEEMNIWTQITKGVERSYK